MTDNEGTSEGAVATAEPTKLDAKALKALDRDAKKAAKRNKDVDDYGIDFGTPFGKLEFELQPAESKKRKDDEKRAQAERDAAKAALKAEKDAAKLAKKHGGEAPVVIRRGGSKLVPILLIFAIIAGSIALAIWLFARPGEEEADVVPPEFRNDEAAAAVVQPQGFIAQAQQRVRDAVRAGRKASREAQKEQEQRFQGMTKG